jgi:hypothetical protein
MRTISLVEVKNEGFPLKGPRANKFFEKFHDAPLKVVNHHKKWQDLCYWDGEYWVYLSTIEI